MIRRSGPPCALSLHRSWLLPIALMLLLPGPTRAATFLIRPDGSGDFPTIQAGIDGSASGDTLLLADGVFTGSGNRNLTLQPYASRVIRALNADPSRCAIDLEGELLGTGDVVLSEMRDIEFRNGRELRGFWSLLRFCGCWFTAPIRVASSTEGEVELEDCTISGATSGPSGLGGGENVSLVRCRVSGCVGGGLFGGFDVSATDCVFEDNTSTSSLLQAYPYMDMTANLVVTGCEFSGNTAPEGMLLCASGHLTVQQCTFSGNYGTSLRFENWNWNETTLLVRSCTMANNQGAQEILIARDAFAGSATLQIERSIVAFREGGCAVNCAKGEITTEVSCCDIYGNAGGDWTGCIAGHLGGAGNISEDPLFCGGANAYELQEGSPCAPGGACAELIGAWPVGCAPAGVVVPGVEPGPLLRLRQNPSATEVVFLAEGEAEAMTLDLYDAAGRWIGSLGGAAARREWTWDGRDVGGRPMPAGIYLYRAHSAHREQRGSFIIAR